LKKFLLILLILSTILNLALFCIQKRREVYRINTLNNEYLINNKNLIQESKTFFNSNNLYTNFNYIIFFDTLNFFNNIKKIQFLDSLAFKNKNLNFLICSSYKIDFMVNYFKKYNLSFSNLKFISHQNSLHSAISNELFLNHKVYGTDAIIDKSGKLIYESYSNKKNNRAKLINVIDSLNKQCEIKLPIQ